jgi:hypothetical protein
MHSGDTTNQHLFRDDTSMSTMTCDGNFPGSESGEQRSVAIRASTARNEPRRAADTPFQRPGAEDVSEAIPVFFIGRNKHGHWVVRGADGKSGGLFWRKQAAVRFATRSAWPARCATIFPSDGIELDLENQGNPLLTHIEVTRMLRSAGAIIGVLLMMAVMVGLVALKAGIFLSRLNY